MNIFQKWFGDSSKNASGSPAAELDAALNKCDLVMVRDEIANMHNMANAEAEKEGRAAIYKIEYVTAWQAFRDRPTISTARAFLEVAPMTLPYFEACSPGGSFAP